MDTDRKSRCEADDTEVARKYSILRPYLDGEVPLAKIAEDAGIALRTAHRWVSLARKAGPNGLHRKARSDTGTRKINPELVSFIEGLALTKPRLSIATIHRRSKAIALEKKLDIPSYASVYTITTNLDPSMKILALDGDAAFRDRYELIHRHRADRPNERWQADHTQLDIVILDEKNKEARPWLTTVLDDFSRAVAGYMLFLDAPSALNTSLALRQAIWRKQDANWPICGIPDILHVDHGSDFTSIHLDQAASDLRFRLIYSTVARPQGRGKVERLFRTINSEVLSELPGYIRGADYKTKPKLSLGELDLAISAFIVNNYNMRVHRSIGVSPLEAWKANGWIPRLPDTLEALDTLLVMVAKPRVVRRDGIHFEGLRFFDPTLAAYVGETITIRYDPRDLGEVRVFHRNNFLCRAISSQYSEKNITIKDIQAARTAHRRQLRSVIKTKRKQVSDFLSNKLDDNNTAIEVKSILSKPACQKLRTYIED